MNRIIYDTSAKPDLMIKTPLSRNLIRYKDYVWGWSFRFASGCFLVGAAGSSILLILYHELFGFVSVLSGSLISLFTGLLSYGLGLIWALDIKSALFDELLQSAAEETSFQREERPEPETAVNPVQFSLNNGLGIVVISQPRRSAFRGWLADCLENPKVLWSLRQARERGWSDEQYQNLIAKLKQVGLLHKDDTYNGAPTMTQRGKELAKEWLK